MDIMEDEPRKNPKPVPFSQGSVLQPTVPEVSLILQDSFNDFPTKKKDSFSGTEFQTYSAWRWKHMSVNDKKEKMGTDSVEYPRDLQIPHVIKDKYFTSDIERRKNEILYGQIEEPRRPLPPRASPAIPKCSDSFFNTSFEDLRLEENNRVKDFKQHITFGSTCNHEKSDKSQPTSNKKEEDNLEKLCNIISEQSKQIEVLQKQVEQVLKLQGVKDNQLEQLLKSQESKEKKIEHLLKALEMKDKETEQLLKLKERQDQQLQELLKIQEVKHKEYLTLVTKLNAVQNKSVCSVGVMTSVHVAEASTNTTLENYNESILKTNNKNEDKELSYNRNVNETGLDVKDKSLSLHSLDLPIVQEHVPTPQSSIHVDIQDFHDSSNESDSDSEAISNNLPEFSEGQINPLGFTFYNNVLTQVKDIIQNSGEKEKRSLNEGFHQNQGLRDCNYVAGQRETLQSYQAWGMCGREKIPSAEELISKGNVTERYKNEYSPVNYKETCSPSDVSLRINALALKYLKQEQISQYDIQTQIPSNPYQRDVTIYNVTNLSFGSMRYLDGYQMLPKSRDPQLGVNVQEGEQTPTQLLRRKKKMTLQENMSPSVGNVLDLSKLNQQPKLL